MADMHIEEYETLNGPTFVVVCGCGYRSSAHGHKSSAIGSGVHHASECSLRAAERDADA